MSIANHALPHVRSQQSVGFLQLRLRLEPIVQLVAGRAMASEIDFVSTLTNLVFGRLVSGSEQSPV